MVVNCFFKFMRACATAHFSLHKSALSFLCVLCCFGLAKIAHAEVSENLVYTSYPANADSSRSLLKILNDASPYRVNGQHFHAYTKWHVQWKFRWFEKVDGRCKITSSTTELTASIDLPRLAGANAKQANQFEKYLSALREHELGHYKLGREAALSIDTQLLSLPEMTNCAMLESAANTVAYQTLSDYKAREQQYDSSTGHGKTQGAKLEE